MKTLYLKIKFWFYLKIAQKLERERNVKKEDEWLKNITWNIAEGKQYVVCQLKSELKITESILTRLGKHYNVSYDGCLYMVDFNEDEPCKR